MPDSAGPLPPSTRKLYRLLLGRGGNGVGRHPPRGAPENPMSLDRLIAYENEFDAIFKELPIWQLPVRPILTALHLAVDGLFNGSRLDDSVRPRPEAGAALGGRLSYIVPQLLKCEPEPTGLNDADALRVVSDIDPDGLNRYVLITYGHFCELMPEVHRGYYAVTGDNGRGFSVALKREVCGVQVIDVLLSRSCLGTENVWSNLRNVVALNLTLLQMVTTKAR